jgi:hypothetical protein
MFMVAQRWASAVPFVGVGAACVIAGGCVSAVGGLAPSAPAAWAAAYLVLVAGVAQVALGAGQAWLAPRAPSRTWCAAELALWNAGNAAVLAGALLSVGVVVDAGGALLVAGLVLLVRGSWGAARGRRRWLLHVFRGLMLLLLVSIPVGLVLAALHPV